MTLHTSTSLLTRRRLLAAAPLGALLAACGGGGDAAAEPLEIQEFSLDATPVRVGDAALLRVRFRGGSGRVEPGLGEVASGSAVRTPALGAAQRYRLVVRSPGGAEVSRELAVPVAWRERVRAFAAPPMVGHALVAEPGGTALVIGGSRGEGVLSQAIERFDPGTLAFTRLGSLATGRADASAVALADGRVLVFGGSTTTSQAPFAELVDPRTGASAPAGAMLRPRFRHAALRLADGRVAAIGGGGRNTLELWNPATATWSLAAGTMAHTREHATATLLPNGQVLIVGGATSAQAYTFAEVFDPATQACTPVAEAPAERRWLHAALALADGSVLIVGGENDDSALASTWRYDPATRRFTAHTPLPSPRSVVRAVATPDDEVLLYGGEEQPDEALASGWAWRGAAQRALPDLPLRRAWHGMLRLAGGQVLVLGGQHRGDYVDGGALYD